MRQGPQPSPSPTWALASPFGRASCLSPRALRRPLATLLFRATCSLTHVDKAGRAVGPRVVATPVK
eukprot:4345060-Pyramimonas_sp.AAC.1